MNRSAKLPLNSAKSAGKAETFSARQRFGRQQEQIAARYLEAQGLRLITSNYLCKMGEIDLIMDEAAILVFVEVRYRRESLYGGAAESVTRRKQQKLIRAARHYLLINRLENAVTCRFDVLGISPGPATGAPVVEWIRNAFQL